MGNKIIIKNKNQNSITYLALLFKLDMFIEQNFMRNYKLKILSA